MYIRFDPAVVEQMVAVRPSWQKYVDDKGRIYLRLNKYLYGLPQASYQFNQFMDHRLKCMGFKAQAGDPCSYTRGEGVDRVMVCLHVDDLLVGGHRAARLKFLERLKKEKFEFTTQDGDKMSYIGMTITKVKGPEGYLVSQEGYRQELMSRFAYDLKNHVGYGNSPASDHLCDPEPDGDTPVDKTHYQGMVMSVMYLARLTRADVLFPTTYLASKCQKPTTKNYNDLCRVLKYLEKNPDYGIMFRKDAGITATIYTDASHGLRSDGKGHVGIIITLGSGYVQAKSTKIKIITLSSTESEGVALCEATTYARWVRAILEGFGKKMETPTALFMDNESAILLTKKDGHFLKNKHVMIRRNYTREGIEMKVVKPMHKVTTQMPADMLTKMKVSRLLKVDMLAAGMIELPKIKDLSKSKT